MTQFHHPNLVLCSMCHMLRCMTCEPICPCGLKHFRKVMAKRDELGELKRIKEGEKWQTEGVILQ